MFYLKTRTQKKFYTLANDTFIDRSLIALRGIKKMSSNKFKRVISTEEDEWIIKGFIDVYRNVYTVSMDTKVISKIIELLLFPVIANFAKEQNYKIIPSKHQNHYPDITFISKDNEKIAVDIKTTYIKDSNSVMGSH
jgi:hypothetical protein